MQYIATSLLFDSTTSQDVAPGCTINLDDERAAVLLDGGHVLPEGTPLFFRVDEAHIYAFVDDSWRDLGWASDWAERALALPYGLTFPDHTAQAPILPTPSVVIVPELPTPEPAPDA